MCIHIRKSNCLGLNVVRDVRVLNCILGSHIRSTSFWNSWWPTKVCHRYVIKLHQPHHTGIHRSSNLYNPNTLSMGNTHLSFTRVLKLMLLLLVLLGASDGVVLFLCAAVIPPAFSAHSILPVSPSLNCNASNFVDISWVKFLVKVLNPVKN